MAVKYNGELQTFNVAIKPDKFLEDVENYLCARGDAIRKHYERTAQKKFGTMEQRALDLFHIEYSVALSVVLERYKKEKHGEVVNPPIRIEGSEKEEGCREPHWACPYCHHEEWHFCLDSVMGYVEWDAEKEACVLRENEEQEAKAWKDFVRAVSLSCANCGKVPKGVGSKFIEDYVLPRFNGMVSPPPEGLCDEFVNKDGPVGQQEILGEWAKHPEKNIQFNRKKTGPIGFQLSEFEEGKGEGEVKVTKDGMRVWIPADQETFMEMARDLVGGKLPRKEKE